MTSNKKPSPVPPAALALYEKLVATVPGIERNGVTLPYTSMNGNMFSFLSGDGALNLRLAEEEREKFITKYKSQISEQHGVVLKEYVIVPDDLLKKTTQLKPWFLLSVAYASSLKAKPTRKK